MHGYKATAVGQEQECARNEAELNLDCLQWGRLTSLRYSYHVNYSTLIYRQYAKITLRYMYTEHTNQSLS